MTPEDFEADPTITRLTGSLSRWRPHGDGVSGEDGRMIHCSKEETEPLLAKSGAFARALPPKDEK
jgi:hypothetical protein